MKKISEMSVDELWAEVAKSNKRLQIIEDEINSNSYSFISLDEIKENINKMSVKEMQKKIAEYEKKN